MQHFGRRRAIIWTLAAAAGIGGAGPGQSQIPSPRVEHTSVWTGSEMLVWGGRGSNGVLSSGGRYDPNTHSWTAISTVGAPSARQNHSAVWTGTEMVVYGGFDYASGTYFADGARYNPTTDTWTTLPAVGTPSARAGHTALWSGTHAIVWGGASNSLADGEVYLLTGGCYAMAGNLWLGTLTNNAPTPRVGHTATWTGSKMIIWGGVADDGVYDPDKTQTGGLYDFPSNFWIPTTTANAPTHRTEHSAVWTGSQMIVWGGLGNGAYDFYNTGGRYNPVADAWLPTSTNGAPGGRQLHTAIWTGTEMIVWGGRTAGSFRNNGGRYNPGADSWIAMPTANAPAARSGHTAIWTGRDMIVWGGETTGGVQLNSIGRYQTSINAWDVPPICSVTSPTNGATAQPSATLLITAAANDVDGTVANVNFVVNGIAIGSRSSATGAVYSCEWINPATGSHTLTVVATDNLGAASTSAPVTVTIVAAGTPPSVSLQNLAGNTQVVAHEPVDLLASASDTDGTVAQVEFFVDGASIGASAAAPFTRTWPAPALGFHNLTAVATDNSGLNSTSAPVTVEVVLRPLLDITPGATTWTIHLTGGETGRVYRVQFSPDLVQWTTFSTNVATNGTLQIPDTVPPSVTQRFYRAVP